ncbi:hypothetical protein [Nostoc sp. LPT]|nr:hypothetical protein [Nostoc sp. LPT]
MESISPSLANLRNVTKNLAPLLRKQYYLMSAIIFQMRSLKQ